MSTFKVAENKVVQVSGSDILFLVTEGTVFEIDHGLKQIFDLCSQKKEMSLEEILSHLEGSFEEKRELFDRLVKRRLIVPANGNAPQKRSAKVTRSDLPVQTLILHVTDACNLSCSYCYYSAEGRNPRKHTRMSLQVARKAVDFLFDHSADLQKLTLVFFGGEPLLGFDLISSVVEYSSEVARKRQKQIDFAITTNGTLLTSEVIHFLNEHHFGITLSMDGFEEVHDRNRRFLDGSPSYRVILPRVESLLRAATERPVVARVTLSGEVSDIPERLDHLLKLGFAEVGFAPASMADPLCRFDSDGMEDLLGQFKTLADKFLDAAKRDEFLGFSNLIDLLVVLHEGEVKSYPCGAGLGLFSVDSEGRLFLCQRFTGEDSFCMGNIFEGFHQEHLDSFRTEALIDRKDACRDCWARALCAGGCYYEVWTRERNIFQANLHYCDWIKRWTEIGLEIYAGIYASNPDYLDKLSMLRGHTSIFNQMDPI